MVIKMFTKLCRRMVNTVRTTTEMENIIKYQIKVTELKNIIIELKNKQKGFNSRLDEAEERISELEDRTVALTQ